MSRKRPKVYKWYTKEVKEPFKHSLTNLQKSTKEGGPKSKNPLAHAHRLQRKKDLHP